MSSSDRELAEKLGKYLHADICSMMWRDDDDCDCGVTDALLEMAAEVRKQYEPSARFAGMILSDSIDVGWGSFNGCEIEDYGYKSGLLESVAVTESCGEYCLCAEVGFPTQCNNLTPAGKAACALADEQKEEP